MVVEAAATAACQQVNEQMAGAKAQFEHAVELAGWQSRSEWATARGDIGVAMCTEGRAVDLIVMGQENEDDDPLQYRGVPDYVILEAGRPVSASSPATATR